MFLYKKYIFKLLWLLPLFLTCNFIFANEKNGNEPHIFVQKGQIHITGDAIIYDSLKEKRPVEKIVAKNNNSQELKAGSKKSLAKTSTKKSKKSAPIFNIRQIKQSNSTDNFSLLVNNTSKAVQNNRERKDSKSTLAKSYKYYLLYKIISDGFIANKTNHYKFDNQNKRLFCRPPPAILYS